MRARIEKVDMLIWNQSYSTGTRGIGSGDYGRWEGSLFSSGISVSTGGLILYRICIETGGMKYSVSWNNMYGTIVFIGMKIFILFNRRLSITHGRRMDLTREYKLREDAVLRGEVILLPID